MARTEKNSGKLPILGTGGTIAGMAQSTADNLVYASAQVPVGDLLHSVPELADLLDGTLAVPEQVAQIDSKDMSFEVWERLALRIRHHLQQPDVRGLVVTHGTDTLEETAYFLQSVLSAAVLAAKPVVLTCAMRPANALAPDGPQNLLDAVAVALTAGACGVLVVCAGVVHGALDVQKTHTYRLDAFSSGEAGPCGYVEEGRFRQVKNWPVFESDGLNDDLLGKLAGRAIWPRVEIVMNYAGASGALVDALLAPAAQTADPVRGLVVAGTGNGSLHHSLEAALFRAQANGVRVVRATRCAMGRVLPVPLQRLPDSAGLSAVKARVALMLALLA